MSDGGTTASAQGGSDQREAEPKLYDASGEPLRTGSQAIQKKTIDPLAEFVQEQPFTATLVALVVGYFIGKIT